MSGSTDAVGYELRGPAAWLTLQRPEKRNAIDPDVLEGLQAGLERALADGARAAVLTGSGGIFCAGADLKYALAKARDVAAMEALLKSAGAVMRAIERHPTPVIAAVNGPAIAGGFELVLACDLVLAAEDAMLADGHAKFGLFPGAGGAVRLPRLLGANRAKYLLFTGNALTAREMRELGVVTDVVPGGKLEATVQKLCERLSRASAAGLARMKRVIDDGLDMPLDEALSVEFEASGRHLRSPDVIEGLTAFAEGRRPSFPSTPKDLT